MAKSKTDIWNELIEKYNSHFHVDIMSFGDLLWQILINKKYGALKSLALTPVEKNKNSDIISMLKDTKFSFQIAICKENEKGYTPTCVHFKSNEYAACFSIMKSLNEDLFKRHSMLSNKICWSSMQNISKLISKL